MGIDPANHHQTFADPLGSWSQIEAPRIAEMVTATADIAVVLDRDGVVRDLALYDPALIGNTRNNWVGRPFAETVTADSQAKVDDLLAVSGRGDARIEIHHPVPDARDLAISYTILKLAAGTRLALGRDLRPVADLQRGLIEAQLAMESEYARLRSAEAQYRQLFDTCGEPTLLVDPRTHHITDANRAARAILPGDGETLAGIDLARLFSPEDARSIDALLAQARATGESGGTGLTFRDKSAAPSLAVRFHRHHGGQRFAIRFDTAPDTPADHQAPGAGLLARATSAFPDAIAVCDSRGLIAAANEAFLDLIEAPSIAQALGRPLEDWIGRRGVEMSLVHNTLAGDRPVSGFATRLVSEHGNEVDIEMSGATMEIEASRHTAFALRPLRRGSRGAADAGAPADGREPLISANEMVELVGRVPLREIVRETVDIIERLCIEAALELTGNNRASAAEMLGLSRQGLYSKLNRYDIGGGDADGTPDANAE